MAIRIQHIQVTLVYFMSTIFFRYIWIVLINILNNRELFDKVFKKFENVISIYHTLSVQCFLERKKKSFSCFKVRIVYCRLCESFLCLCGGGEFADGSQRCCFVFWEVSFCHVRLAPNRCQNVLKFDLKSPVFLRSVKQS